MSASERASAGGPWPALLFLWRRSLLNRWRGWIRRLRQPRYAAAFVLGLAYFAWLAFGMSRPGNGQIDPDRSRLVAADAAPILLLLMVALAWAGGRAHMVLAFSAGEVHFLFQGPIARRTLLHYKLLRAQAAIVPGALVFTIVVQGLLPLPWPLLTLGLWAVMSTIHLHQVAASLVRSSWTHHGGAGLRRQWVPLLVLAVAGAIVIGSLVPLVPALEHSASPGDLGRVLHAALSGPAVAAVLFPFRWLAAPLVAPGAEAWASGLLEVLALAALNYLWVLRLDTAFQETAMEAGIELQAITSAMKEGRGFAALRVRKGGRVKAPWFRLGPEGRPAVALFWKSFTAFTRSLSPASGVIIVVAFVAFRIILGVGHDSPREIATAWASIPAMLSGMVLLMGPIFLRNDLRTALQRQELMRTFPLSGQSVVAAEVAASGLSLSAVVGFFLTVSAVFFAWGGAAPVRPWLLAAGWAASLLVAIPLCVLAMGVQNALVVVYPGWASLGPMQQRGMDQMGTMMLMMIVTMVLLGIGVLVPVLAAVGVAVRLLPLLGLWCAVPAAVAAWAALVGESVLLVTLLGDAYDEMDPSEAGLLGS